MAILLRKFLKKYGDPCTNWDSEYYKSKFFIMEFCVWCMIFSLIGLIVKGSFWK